MGGGSRAFNGAAIDRSSPVPIYVQLKEIIREAIEDERLGPNARIPSELELSAEFSVSRMTVRQAIRELAHEGYVYVRRGEGTFVGRAEQAQMLIKLDGFSTEMKKRGHSVHSKALRTIEIRDAGAYSQVYAGLEERPGNPLVMIERIRYLDEEPFAVERSFLSYANGGALLTRQFDGCFSIYNYLATERRITLVRAEHAIEPCLASDELAQALQIPAGSPILCLRGTTYSANGGPVEYLEGWYRGDRYVFRVSIEKSGASHG